MNLESFKGKLVHFIGIGGVSMSGIAKCFAQNSVLVQGSDSAIDNSKYLEGFESLGIKLIPFHKKENISQSVALVVKTSTVTEENPEIIQARKFGIPILERFEALQMIISSFSVRVGISGSSGKTTTTALTWQALCSATNIKHSCIIGTILNETKSTVFVNNDSNICVVEADESDGSFALMNFTVAIITDIDTDHLDHFRYSGKQEDLIAHFRLFAEKTLYSNGIVIYNSDCKTTHALMQNFLPKFQNNIYSYSGIEKVVNFIPYIKGDCFLEEVQNEKNGINFSCKGLVSLQGIKIPMIGKINAFNALPGLMLSKILFQYESSDIFTQFQGVNKRAEIVGQNSQYAVIDDYAHSPKKIRAFIDSFSSFCHSVEAEFVIICEPHKYTRVESLYSEYVTCFDSCNYLVLMEIFGIQGRNVIDGVSSQKLAIDIENRWKEIKNHKFAIKSLQNNSFVLKDSTFSFVKEFPHKKQFVFFVFIGAGFSSNYAHLFWNSIK